MSLIVDANGHQYTSADQELRVRKLKHDFSETLQEEMTAALRAARPGQTLKFNLQPLFDVIDQAYFLGRQDG